MARHNRPPEFVSGIDIGDLPLSQRDPRLTPDMIARVRNRDVEALNVFFDIFFDRAYGYVCRLVRNPDDAEDITQVAFMKIHRAVHTLDIARDPTSWVFAVVANTVRDYWRSKRYKQSRMEKPIDKTVLSTNLTAEDDQHARDAARVLEKALEELSEKLRAVVLLRDYQDLSYGEVAKVLGIAEAAARKRHSRALAELRKAMDDAAKPRDIKNQEKRP